MKHSFTLQIKAFSINAYHYSDKRHKTAEARAWEEQVLALLQDEKLLVDMADMWRKSGGTFRVHMTFGYPQHLFYNKAGAVSSKTFDLSNTEKPLLDLIFNRTMDVDDKHVVVLHSRKVPGSSYYIDFDIELETNT